VKQEVNLVSANGISRYLKTAIDREKVLIWAEDNRNSPIFWY